MDVRSLLATSDGGIWIGYRNGAAFLKQDKATFYTEQQGLPYGQVGNLAQTSDGAIWAAVDGGLARLSSGRWERIHSNWNYSNNSAKRVLVDAAGTLWVTGEGYIHFLLRGSRRFVPTTVKVSSWTELCDRARWLGMDRRSRSLTTLFNFQEIARSMVTVFSIPEILLQGIYGMSALTTIDSLWIATDRALYFAFSRT